MKLIDGFNTPIHHEQIRALYQQSPFLFLGILAVMTVVTVFFWGRVEAVYLVSWLVINLLLTLTRILLVKAFHQVKPEGITLVNWGLVFVLSATLSGILWGAIVPLFMDPDDIESVLLVSLVLTGMSSGSQVALSTFLPAFYGFGLPALLPLAITLLAQPNGIHVLIGYLVVAFIIVNLGFSFVINRNVSESIQLRFENLDLLRNLKLQKALAEKANTDKSRFLAATSHDLRQPLHAMDLYLGALQNLITDKEQSQLLAKGQQSSAVLNELLSALMDVSRLDAGDVTVNHKVFDIAELVQTICDEYQQQTNQQGMVLQVQASSLHVDSDTVMLGRMLRNLISNACFHSGASKITVKVEKVDWQVVISVCDDGKGIPFDEQQQVFSEFYQLENAERDRNKGLGLGLAIVRRLANLLGYDLQLESREGEGCCFRIVLPFVDDEIYQDVQTEYPEALDVSGLFVVLVDDEKAIRHAMRTLLLQWGCELIVADGLHSLQQELDMLDYPVPNVLLCDYRLRESQTGLDVVAAIRERFDENIPAVIISGDTDRLIEKSVFRQGCEMLYKPVQPEVLRAAIFKAAGSRVTNT